MKTLLRVIVIGAILLILVFLSIGIVKIVPKALSSLASATVSISSIFGGSNATSTNASANNGASIAANGNGTETVVPNGNGFIVIGSSTPNGANSNGTNGNPWTAGANTTKASTSLLDLITPKFGQYPYNNYVPTPATSTNSGAYTTGTSHSSGSNTGTGNSGASYSNYPTNYARTCTAGAQPDLAVSILSRGVINSSGQYVETNNFTTGDTVSIKFKIENRGLCSTGTWGFKAEMPSNNAADQVRTVANVASIPAGAAVTGQANFDSPRAGTSNVVFTVTDNSGRDANTSNNVATSALVVTNSGTIINGNGNGTNGGVITSGDGRADLAVRILQTGVLTYNNQFVPTNTIGANSATYPYYGNGSAYGGSFKTGDRVAVKFEITNQGQSATGAWNFRADLTGNGASKTYQNPQYENSIPPGGRAVYTIAFDNMQTGSSNITIFADNLNQVNEFNEGNNTASVGFDVSY
jgi:hypothetical protein